MECAAGWQIRRGHETLFDASKHKTRIAAEVKGFDAVAAFGVREARKMDRFTQFATVATLEALEQSGLKIDDVNRDRVGIVIGTGIGGIGTIMEQAEVMRERGVDRVSPFLIPMMISDSAAGMLAIRVGARGPNMAIATACASGNNAIGDAMETIRRGSADAMIAGGSEGALVSLAMAGMNIMGALSTRNDDPLTASRPFDKNRDGFLMGEGAGILILEELEYAKARGANILCELTGYGTTDDAHHISAPAENGAGAAMSMKLALEDASLTLTDIGYINAHGTSTPLGDIAETKAILNVFGEHAYELNISSTKSMTGHCLGAAGALETLACILAVTKDIVPPTINHFTDDPELDSKLNFTFNKAQHRTVNAAISNTFGFGGHNASVIVKKYKP